MSLKIGLYIAAVLFVLALFGKTYQAGREHEREKLTAQWQAKYDSQVNESRAKEQKQRDDIHAASTRYEEQIAALRADASAIPIVRVPKCPRRLTEPSAATSGSQPSETAADELAREDGQAGRAIQFSHGLREYARDCQAIAIQLTEVIRAWPK